MKAADGDGRPFVERPRRARRQRLQAEAYEGVRACLVGLALAISPLLFG